MTSLSIISNVRARMVFNSRGEETVEVEVNTLGGRGRAAAPAGKSKGKYEVTYFPKGGVGEALRNFKRRVEPRLVGLDADDQASVDRTLHEADGTRDFNCIGGNTAYAVSLASAEAAASTHKIPLFSHLSETKETRLPLPLGNVLGGGKHAGKGAPDIQEFLVIPAKCETFSKAFAVNIGVHREVGELLRKRIPTFTGGRGDEGAWAPRTGNEDALEMVVEAAEKVSGRMGVPVGVGLDVAASSLWNPRRKSYVYAAEGKTLDEGGQVDYILRLIRKYRLVYVEDPVHEDDFEGFAELTRKVKDCLICGDDLFVTSKSRLRVGIRLKAAKAVIIKPNQVGTVSDAYEAVKAAKASKLVPVISHRSGETADHHLAHLAVAFGCPIIKTGVLNGERTAKLNELMRIEESLQGRASLADLRSLMKS